MMKFILVISAFIAVCAASEDIFFSEKFISKAVHEPAPFLFNGSYFPRLDHFRPQDDRTLTFHYRLNLDHYREGGPLFLYINDAGQFTTEWIEEGLMVDVARNVGGALITADHRYFGLNIPTDTSAFEELVYLTVDQAVADIAVLVSTLHEHLSTDNPRVLVWGTGYGASLATFARKKYPHLIDATFASSGLFRAEVFDTSYHDNLSSNLRILGSTQCHQRVQNAFDILEYLFLNGQSEYVQERLRLCNAVDIDNTQEVGLLFERFIDLISGYIARFNLFGLENFCRDMDFYPDDTLNSLIRWAVYAYGTETDECINANYPQYVEQLRNTVWEDTNYPGVRARYYLRCTQTAAFRIASDYELTAFPSLLDAEYHFRFCEDVFGEAYNRDALLPAVENLNNQFGGQAQVVPFVIFTNAGLDPWIGHGVSDYHQEEGAVIFLYYSASGADLSSISLDEPFELTRAKEQIYETMVRWAQRN